jgi:hypothetical protein
MPAIKPANPRQIAMFGHIARALQAKGWKAADLNEAMGFKREYSACYQWINGKSAPGPMHRKKLAKVTGIPESELTRREPGKALVAMPALQAMPVTRVKLTSEVLSFAIDSNGNARIKLDVTMPMHLANPFVRMLLDANLVFSKDETNETSKA